MVTVTFPLLFSTAAPNDCRPGRERHRGSRLSGDYNADAGPVRTVGRLLARDESGRIQTPGSNAAALDLSSGLDVAI